MPAASKSRVREYSTVSPDATTPSVGESSPGVNPFFEFTNVCAAVPCPVPSDFLTMRAVVCAGFNSSAFASGASTGFDMQTRPAANVAVAASTAMGRAACLLNVLITVPS